MSIALGTIFGDLRLKLAPLQADAETANGVLTGLREKLAQVAGVAEESGAKVADGAKVAADGLKAEGTAAEEAGTKTEEAGKKGEGAGQGLKKTGEGAEAAKGGLLGLIASTKELVAGFLEIEAVSKVFEFLSDQIHETMSVGAEAEQVQAQLASTIKSTGDASGMTLEQLNHLSEELAHMSGVSAETIGNGQKVLLTFTAIGKQVFPDATKAALDLSQRMGMDMASASMMVGKALNDPIKGVGMLRRVGVQLDEQQQKAIKTFMKHGDIVSAQNVILGELNREMGGAAEAYGTTLPGQMGKFNVAMDAARIAVFNFVKGGIENVTNALAPLATELAEKIPDALNKVGNFLGSVGGKLQGFATFVQSNPAALNAFKAALIGLGAGLLFLALGAIPPLIVSLGGMAVAAWAAAAPILAILAPVFLIAAGVALLVFAFKQWYDSSQPVRDTVAALLKTLQSLWGMIVSQLKPILDQLGQTFKTQILPAWNSLLPVLKQALPALQAVGAVIGGVLVIQLGLLIGFITGTAKGFALLLAGVIQAVGGIIQVVSGLVQVVVALVGGIINIITDLVTGHLDRIGPDLLNMLSGIGSGLLQILGGLWNIIAGLFKGAIGAVWGLVSGFVQGVIGFFQHLFETLVGHSIVPDLINKVIGFFLSLPLKILGVIAQFVAEIIMGFLRLEIMVLSAIGEMVDLAVNFFVGLGARIISTVVNFVVAVIVEANRLETMVLAAVSSMVDKFLAFLVDLSVKVKDTVQTIVHNILGPILDLGQQLFDAGKNLIQQLINGILSLAGGVTSAVGNIAGNIKNFLGWHSPTKEGPGRDSHTWTPNLMGMLERGINDGAPNLARAAGNAAQAIRKGLQLGPEGLGLDTLGLDGDLAGLGGHNLATGANAVGLGAHTIHHHHTTHNIDLTVDVTQEPDDPTDPEEVGAQFGHSVGTTLAGILTQRGY